MPRTWKTRLVIRAIPAAAAAATALLVGLGARPFASDTPLPDLVDLAAGSFAYRVGGDFTRGGSPATAPIVTASTPTLAVMRHQVTAGEYRRCADAGACRRGDETSAADVPMVKISWWDAAGYAAWLSRSTGMSFRLPSDAEWIYAAGGRVRDVEGPREAASRDPGQRALDRYERETAIKSETDSEPRPVGHFGTNEHGLLDVAGNVWEWTDSCFARGIINAGGEPSTTTVDCGVRVVEGRHRTYLTDFIRDARAGGCTAGLPPGNLGFRLVLDDDWRRRLRAFADRVKRALTHRTI